jgi:parvulin-like peptidyl-prolyl isomerase
MRRICLVCTLLVRFACGQAAIPFAQAQPVVNADDPVITLDGFCGALKGNSGECQTIITRAQFEKLAEALDPGMTLPLRLKVANSYARNLRMAAAAEKRGLDKTPAFEEEVRFARMQLLSRDLDRALHVDAENITEAEIEDYYKKNRSSFEEATLARIFVPRAKQTSESRGGNQETEEEMTKVAAEVRARAVNGEDPDQLQRDAYAKAGFPATTVDTKMEKVRRATLPPQHEAVMNLKPGEVSQVFSDPSGAHFIYKMIARETQPLESARDEIRKTISSQRYRESMKSFDGSVSFSDAYFNPPVATTAAAQQHRRERKKNAAADPD